MKVKRATDNITWDATKNAIDDYTEESVTNIIWDPKKPENWDAIWRLTYYASHFALSETISETIKEINNEQTSRN